MGIGWKALVCAIASTVLCLLPIIQIWSGMKSGAMKANVGNTLDAQQMAWNNGDLDGFMLGYWNDPELAFYSDNTIEKGYEPLKQRYFKKYKAEGKEMGKLTFSEVDVQPKSESFAVVRGHWKVEKSKETAEGLFTLWVEKKPEGWRIVHDHTSAAPKTP
jgi:beta-aspartyl-peptidase (threonine type)